MIVTDIYNHRFHRIFATNENLSSIMERDDIYVWVLNFADRHTLLSKAWNVIQVLTSLKFWALVYHVKKKKKRFNTLRGVISPM